MYNNITPKTTQPLIDTPLYAGFHEDLYFPVMGNHIKSSLMNQASSDSELTKFKTKLLLEAQGDLQDPDLHKDGSNTKGLFLPGVQNMKHNVSEKVAQVSDVDYSHYSVQNKKMS